ncbi:porin family protein [Flexithrix dorotheae]|uniref:porin family protein n=1 Tax=Flexithrix dorotheae TaxID=70993 RepID=UPI00038174EA|nr:porin family protein [Flexithrix dorotheae]
MKLKRKLFPLFLLLLATPLISIAQNTYSHLYPGYFGNGRTGKLEGIYVGLKGGVNFSDFTRELLVNPDRIDSYNSILSPTAGILIAADLHERLFLRSEFSYIGKGVSYESKDDISTITNNRKLTYIEIPLILNYYLNNYGYRLRPYVGGGVNIGFLMSAIDYKKEVYNSTGELVGEESENDVTKFHKNLEFGISGNLGLNYQISYRSYLNFDIRGTLGLSNINNPSPNDINNPYTVNVGVVGSLGFLYEL